MLLANVSRRLTDCTRHADTRFPLSNFERSVLGSIKTKFNGKMLVGKINRWNALDEIYLLQIPSCSRHLIFKISQIFENVHQNNLECFIEHLSNNIEF